MKKFRFLPLFAFALAIAASAFTLPSRPAPAATDSLYWFIDPNDGSSYQGQNTTPDEKSATGCTFSGNVCEKGYTSAQLVNPSDPTQGVLSSQVNNGQIIRQQ